MVRVVWRHRSCRSSPRRGVPPQAGAGARLDIGVAAARTALILKRAVDRELFTAQKGDAE
jgi:hypothetical protein